MAASKAISVPWLILVRNTIFGNDLITLDTSSSEFVLITSSTIDFLFTWYKALGTNWILADYTAEAFLVPLSCLVFHLLGASTEDFTASIASAGKLGIITVTAVNLVYLTTKLFVNQGHSAFVAKETSLMPMLVLVR